MSDDNKFTKEDHQFLKDFSAKDKIWDKQKNTSKRVENTLFKFHNSAFHFITNKPEHFPVIRSVFNEMPDKNKLLELSQLAFKKGNLMNSCGANLIFALNTDQDDKLVHRLIRAEFCKFRYCPVCAWRKSLKLKALMLSRLDGIVENNKNLSYLFLTLTMRNDDVENIDQMLDQLNSGFRKLTQQKFFKSSVKGVVKAIEITRGKDGKAHPHIHAVLAVSSCYFQKENYKKTDELVQIWRKALDIDYDPVVDIRRVYSKTEKESKTKTSPKQKLSSVVAEALKYSVKGSDLSDMKFLIHLMDKTRGKRFLSSTGVFKGIFKENLSNDDLIHINEDEERNKKPDDIRAYTFHNNYKKYVRNLVLEDEERQRDDWNE